MLCTFAAHVTDKTNGGLTKDCDFIATIIGVYVQPEISLGIYDKG